MRMLLFLLIAALSVPARAETLMHDGVERHFIVEDGGPGSPALLVLHGGAGNGERIRRTTRFDMGPQGWTLIYPDGLNKSWNDGRHSLRGVPLRATDDLGFLQAMVQRLAVQGRIDPNRVFAVGLSNGGAMTQRIVCQSPDLLAGAVVAIMNFPVGLECPPGQPVPMLFILGTQDPLVPYNGGPITVGRRDRGRVLDAEETFRFYARRNGCAGQSEILLADSAPGDGVRVRKRTYAGCSAPLQALIMEGGGHVWPGRQMRPVLRRLLGNEVLDIDGSRVTKDFVTRLARP